MVKLSAVMVIIENVNTCRAQPLISMSLRSPSNAMVAHQNLVMQVTAIISAPAYPLSGSKMASRANTAIYSMICSLAFDNALVCVLLALNLALRVRFLRSPVMRALCLLFFVWVLIGFNSSASKTDTVAGFRCGSKGRHSRR